MVSVTHYHQLSGVCGQLLFVAPDAETAKRHIVPLIGNRSVLARQVGIYLVVQVSPFEMYIIEEVMVKS